jgi:hypothetical protein
MNKVYRLDEKSTIINGKAGIDYELLIVFVRRRMPSTYNANQHNLFPGNPRQAVHSQNLSFLGLNLGAHAPV